jgi:putative flippase GtrA
MSSLNVKSRESLVRNTLSPFYARIRTAGMFVASLAGHAGVPILEAKRFIKFAVVGAIGFVVDFGVFNLLLNPFALLMAPGTAVHQGLVSLGLSTPQVATLVPTFPGAISFVMAILSNFLWNRYWTYPDSRSKSFRRQFAQFWVVSVTGILIRVPIITFTHQAFTQMIVLAMPTLSPLSVRLGKNLALVLSVLVVMFWNFFVNRYWTYSDVNSENDDAGTPGTRL